MIQFKIDAAKRVRFFSTYTCVSLRVFVLCLFFALQIADCIH